MSRHDLFLVDSLSLAALSDIFVNKNRFCSFPLHAERIKHESWIKKSGFELLELSPARPSVSSRPLVSVATRAKMSMMNSMSRMRGQEKGPGYTQTEATLGEAMQRFGRELGEESNFGES